MVYENERGCVKMLTQPHQVTGVARNSQPVKTRSLVLLPLRSNEIDINNKGIGYLLEPLLFLSEEREEL